MDKTPYCSLVVLIVSLFYHVVLHAQEKAYFDDHARGWHWYESSEEENDDEESSDPIAQMSIVQMTVKRALDRAYLVPTKENVKKYMAIQNQVTERSAQFSKLWEEALLEDPRLDFSVRHPTNNLARQVEVDQENAMEEQAIKKLAQESGLFFFYRSSCPYCRVFAPILKHLADQYGISVIPITTDGIALPEFPRSYPDQGQAAVFQVKVEPSLFIVNPYTHKKIPVGYGLMSEMDLKKRILEIVTDHGGGLQ